MKRRPLFIQLFLSYVPIVIVGFIILFYLTNQITRTFFYSYVKNDLLDRAHLVSKIITNKQSGITILSIVKNSAKDTNMRITVVDEKGNVVGDSDQDPLLMDNHAERPEIVESKKAGIGSSQRFSNTLNQEMMYLAIPLSYQQKNWTVRVSMSLYNLEKVLTDLQKRITFLGCAIAIALLIISFILSRQVTVPLQLMKKDAEDYVNNFELKETLRVPNTKELASLSISLNRMAVEIDRKIKMIQQEKDERGELLSSMQDGIISLDHKLNVLSINDIAKKNLHIKTGYIIGKKITNVIKQKKVISFLKKAKKNKGRSQDEIVIKRNKKRTFLLNCNPLIKRNKISGILVTMTDVTFQKQLERVRQDFVANVSHELKTPITSILGYMEIIQSSELSDSKKSEFYIKVLNQTNRMNNIIDDLLRLSKIESQEEDNSIELIDTNISSILEGARDDVLAKAELGNNRILIHCGQINASVDAQLLREAIVNLLENAIKYGDKGRDIKIIVEKDDLIKIHVENSGIQIHDQEKQKIFQRFYRIDKSRDRKGGGTGLGLAIVKHISLVHGGEVFVSSSKKGKCRFTLSLPMIPQTNSF